MELSLSVGRAVALEDHLTVMGGRIVVPLEEGSPSPTVAVQNSRGDWVVEVPLSDDPDILPSPIYILAKESWTGATIRKAVTADHTFENPLWISGTLKEVAEQPGVIPARLWEVDAAIPTLPVEAEPGDYIFYVRQGSITKLVTDDIPEEEI
jgi:hypothetical protein